MMRNTVPSSLKYFYKSLFSLFGSCYHLPMKKCTNAAKFYASLTPEQKETLHQLLHLSKEGASSLERLVYDLQ